MTYGFVPIAAKKVGAADIAVQIVTSGSVEADEIEKIILKEVNKNRYPPARVVQRIREAGFPKFSVYQHTLLWKALDAKKDGKGYGCVGDYGNWVWFDRWIDRVQEHCEAEGEKYR